MSCQNKNEFIEVDEGYLDKQKKTNLSGFAYCEYEDEENDFIFWRKGCKESGGSHKNKRRYLKIQFRRVKSIL